MWIRSEEPDYSAIVDAHCYWGESMHEEVEEALPTNSLELSVKHTVTISYHDYHICSSEITGRSDTGVLHL